MLPFIAVILFTAKKMLPNGNFRMKFILTIYYCFIIIIVVLFNQEKIVSLQIITVLQTKNIGQQRMLTEIMTLAYSKLPGQDPPL